MDSWIFLIIIISIYILLRILFYVLDIVKEQKERNSIYNERRRKPVEIYGEVDSSSDDFDTKVNSILSCIKKGETDIKEIAKVSHCTYPECVMKIRYLKTAKKLENYYLDPISLRVFPCDKEDEALLKKYLDSLYKKHLSVEEMTETIYKLDPYNKTKEEYRDDIFNDLKYLSSKKLLEGIVLNEVDKSIKYYLDQNKERDLVTVHCPNCGSLNDVDVDSKTRCKYCNTIIIVDKTE